MLVLSRKVGQEIVIDENIRIVIQRVSGNRVSIGIDAPESVHVLRGELHNIRGQFEIVDSSESAEPGESIISDVPNSNMRKYSLPRMRSAG